MKLSRRHLLQGMGAAIALPALEAHGGSASTRRLVVLFGPNGMVPTAWHPTDSGTAYTLSPSLTPLAPVRDDVLVLSNLDNVPGPPIHTFRTRSLLSERLPDGTYGARFGRTVDQLIADHIRDPAQIHSLQVTSEGATACGTLECAQLYATSWTDEFVPASRLVHPRALFERLFGSVDADAASRARRIRQDRSVLDAVLEDGNRLHTQLGQEDRSRLDAWFTAIREVEAQLDAPVTTSASCSQGPELEDTVEVDALVEQMLDLVTLAMQCDRTRVLTYMIGAAESYRPLSFLGLPGDHHTASHFVPASHEAITTWQVSKYASLVSRMATHIQPNGRRLLDDTSILYVSGISDAVAHAPDNLPVLLAGGGVTGEHRVLAEGTPFAGFSLALAQSFGVPVTRFGLDGISPALTL